MASLEQVGLSDLMGKRPKTIWHLLSPLISTALTLEHLGMLALLSLTTVSTGGITCDLVPCSLDSDWWPSLGHLASSCWCQRTVTPFTCCSIRTRLLRSRALQSLFPSCPIPIAGALKEPYQEVHLFCHRHHQVYCDEAVPGSCRGCIWIDCLPQSQLWMEQNPHSIYILQIT